MAFYYHPSFQQFYTQGLFGPPLPSYNDHNDEPLYYHPYSTLSPSNDYHFSSLPGSSSPPGEHYSPPAAIRARSITPPPPPCPSPSYLELASTPSITLSEPTRKLLILDLNGTLLLRSPRPPKSSRGHYRPHPSPRHVMRRPYLTALRAYLFAPQTRAWLDVMVWSSAQPHSVEDMVSHALGDDRKKLVAMWARDTLGLGQDHYHRKVQTIKDLEKPWVALTPRRSRSASPSSSPSAVAPKLEPSSPKWAGHSAATTILLDDSHAKAALQPHNHLCVPEYSREQRNSDLAVLQHAKQQSTPRQENSAAAALAADADADSDSLIASSVDGVTEKVRKRKRKKTKSKSKAQQQSALPATADGVPATFDETLLAVIGILHAARLESSVAGWLRAGALFLPPSEGGNDDGDAKSWFNDPALVRAWASRGREAMHELQLEVEHGVEP